jgi:hypothetical protein
LFKSNFLIEKELISSILARVFSNLEILFASLLFKIKFIDNLIEVFISLKSFHISFKCTFAFLIIVAIES